MEEKTITISVTEEELRMWRDFKELRTETRRPVVRNGDRFIARALRKKIEKELEKLE